MDKETATGFTSDGEASFDIENFCPLCGKNIEANQSMCNECQDELDVTLDNIYFCQACGAHLADAESTCSECGTNTSILNTPASCIVCGKITMPNSEYCSNCIIGADEESKRVISTQFDTLTDELTSLFEKARGLGLLVSLLEREYEGAKLMMEAGEGVGAVSVLEECKEKLKSSIMQYEVYISAYQRARARIDRASQEGCDVEEALLLLTRAEYLARMRDYKQALICVIKCSSLADRDIKQKEAWKVELGAYVEK